MQCARLEGVGKLEEEGMEKACVGGGGEREREGEGREGGREYG